MNGRWDNSFSEPTFWQNKGTYSLVPIEQPLKLYIEINAAIILCTPIDNKSYRVTVLKSFSINFAHE